MTKKKVFIGDQGEFSKDGDKFYKNDEELKREDGEGEFDEQDFKECIRLGVNEFINKSFENIVVLLGAGASIVSNTEGIDENYGATVSMIGELIHEKLKEGSESDKKLFSIEELASLVNYKVAIETSNGFNSEFNLEDFLSKVITFQQFIDNSNKSDMEKYYNTKKVILDTIKDKTNYSYDDVQMKHTALIKLMNEKVAQPNKLSIVTTNYDTMIEEAAAQNLYTVIDGFTFTETPSFDSEMFEWNLVREIPNVKTQELEYKKNILNLLKIHGSLNWESSIEGNAIYKKSKSEIKEPLMIFPSSNKYMQSYEEPYFALFNKFQDLLKKPNTLLITSGFSFADNHIASMVIQAIKRNNNLGVLITDYSIEEKNNNWGKLLSLQKDHFRIAFLSAVLNGELIDYLGGRL